MNLSLFASKWAVLAAATVAVFVLWMVLGGVTPGEGFGSNGTFQIVSGWVAFSLMLVVFLYTARKRLYQLKLSPETRNRLPIDRLERAEARLNEIRGDIRRQKLQGRREIEQMARRALREEGVSRVIRTEVVENRESTRGVDPFLIQVWPTEPLGRVASWLHAHLYLGLAFAVLALLHGGGSLDSVLGATMNVLTYVVVITGLVGIVLFARGPTWIVEKERDLPYEKAFVLNHSLGVKIDEALGQLDPGLRPLFAGLGRADGDARARRLGEIQSRAIGLDPKGRRSLEDLAVLLTQKAKVQTTLDGLWRIKFWINVWRVIHVPASVLLVAAVVAHVISVWRY